jgi:O-antigen ligase
MTNIYNASKIKFLWEKLNTSNILLSLILISLPLKTIYISIGTISFICWIFFFSKKEVNYSKIYFLPIAFFSLMIFSLSWSHNLDHSLFVLQKQLPFLFIPIAFILLVKRTKEDLSRIIRVYSFGMVLFGFLLLIKACFRYFHSNDVSVFFHNKLVPNDLGAIYLSVFASFAIFYFIQIQTRNIFEKSSIVVLAVLIFLLSSKSIITIDFIIIICYYTFFVTIPSGTKAITILSVSIFLIFSVLYVKEVRERFLIEYETAFIDNTLNYDLTKEKQNIYNVSINEAWNKRDFHQNSFFPGTALRIYQTRVFLELLHEQKFFLSGFGLEASQDFIKNKAKEHNLNAIYWECNFHNQYLQTLADLGVLGFGFLVWMLFVNLKNAFKNKNFLHMAFAITMIMLFLSESFFCRQRGIVFFITLYCLFNTPLIEKKEEIKSL